MSKAARAKVGLSLAAALVAGFAAVTLVSDTVSTVVTDRTTFCTEFVPNMEGSQPYIKWGRNAPLDKDKWLVFRTGICNNENPLPPDAVTLFGKALIAVGKIALDEIESPTTTTTTTPPPSEAWAPPITITSGGTYSGSWESIDSTPTIRIATTEPVVIENSRMRNLTGARLIVSDWPLAVNLTIRNCRAYGGAGRFIELEGHKSFVMENCTLDKTSGVRLNVDAVNSSAVIRYNRHLNIQHDTEAFGNFVQLNGVNQGTVLIEWNEIVNEYNLSYPEDLVSIYASNNVTLRNNMFWHESLPGNVYNASSQGGITLEEGSSGCLIEDNQVVDGYGIVISTNGGTNNTIQNNRVIADRLLSNGEVKGNGWGYPVVIIAGSNNHAHRNYVSYIDRDGHQGDDFYDATYPTYGAQALRGAAEGGVAEFASNTLVRAPTNASEQDEWTSWVAKKAANGVTVGAS